MIQMVEEPEVRSCGASVFWDVTRVVAVTGSICCGVSQEPSLCRAGRGSSVRGLELLPRERGGAWIEVQGSSAPDP